MHYYKFNIGDYASHTLHLDPLEDIAYRRMLDWVYLHESALPDSPEQIGRLIRMRTHSECIAVVLQEFFVLTDYGWIQEKAMHEISDYKDKSKKAKASAAARWAKTTIEPDANALRPESERNAKHKPLTTNQEPLTTNQEPLIKEGFERFWIAGMTKQNKQGALKAFTKQHKESKQEIGAFTDYLISDVQQRVAANVFGFDKMHPTTYLNQKRWHDDIVKQSSDSMSKPERTIGNLQGMQLADIYNENPRNQIIGIEDGQSN